MSNYRRICRMVLMTGIVFASLSVGTCSTTIAASAADVQKSIDLLIKTNACVGCNLQGADLNRLDLSGADLRDANLRGASLYLVNLSNGDLRGADLRESHFGGTDLANADLRGADLRGVVLVGAYLVGTKIDTDKNEGVSLQDRQEDNTQETSSVADAAKLEEASDAGPVQVDPSQQAVHTVAPEISENTIAEDTETAQHVTVPTADGDNGPPKKMITQPVPVSIEAQDQKQTPSLVEPEANSGTDRSVAMTEDTSEPAGKADASEIVTENSGVEQIDEPAHADEAVNDLVARLLDSGKCYACNLVGVNLSKKSLRNADLESANFTGAVLEQVDLTGGNFKNVSFRDANLRNADFSRADLYKADFTGADLTGAIFKDAQLDEAVFTGAVGYKKMPMTNEHAGED